MKIAEVSRGSSLDDQLQKYASGHRLLFHSHQWLSCYDSRLVQCAVLNNNDEIAGCFLFFRYRKKGLRLIISPPYTPGIALYSSNPAMSVVGRNTFEKDVLTAVGEYFRALKPHFLDVQLSDHTMDVQPLIWMGFKSAMRYTYLVDLTKTTGQLLDDLSSEKRKSINKAVKDGIDIAVCEDKALINKMITSRLHLKGMGKNLDILEKIISGFTGTPQAICYVASKANDNLAVTFCVVNGDRAVYVLGGVGGEVMHHGAGVSCMWQSILHARRAGLKQFDFEGSMDKNIERYFREFGGQMQAYPAVHFTKKWVGLLMRLK